MEDVGRFGIVLFVWVGCFLRDGRSECGRGSCVFFGFVV